MTDNERLFRIIWPERCWHEVRTYYSGRKCSCGIDVSAFHANVHPCASKNPTFAHSDEIAQAMMEKGLWDGFIGWLDDKWEWTSEHEWRWGKDIYGTLITPELLKRAIIAWREGE